MTLLDRVLAEAWRRDSPLHGEAHWLAVATTGLDLAAETGADPQIVSRSGAARHPARERQSRPWTRPSRGSVRAELHHDGDLLLDEGRLELLCLALELHADGRSALTRPLAPAGTPTGSISAGWGRTSSSTRAAVYRNGADADAQAAAVARASSPLGWERLLAA